MRANPTTTAEDRADPEAACARRPEGVDRAPDPGPPPGEMPERAGAALQ